MAWCSRTRYGRALLPVLWAAVIAVGLVEVGSASQVRITLLHTNDLHGNAAAVTRMANLVQQLRNQSGNIVLLDAGDTLGGCENLMTTSANQPASAMFSLLNALHYDAWVPGNHDFDFSLSDLIARTADANFQPLLANLPEEQRPANLSRFKPYAVLTRGKVRIAILGLSVARAYADLTVTDAVECARRYVPQLHRQAAVVVALTHEGLDGDRQLATAVQGIDIILGGHSHTVLHRPEKIGETAICQAGGYGEFLGRTDVTVDDNTGKVLKVSGQLLRITARIPKAPKAITAVDDLLAPSQGHLQRLGTVLGNVTAKSTAREGDHETAVGDWLADVMRQAARADLTLTTTIGMTPEVAAGPFTLLDAYSLYPWPRSLVVVSLAGKVIPSLLEKSVEDPYYHLYASGLKMRYNPRRPKGQRLLSAAINSQPLDPDRFYRIATDSWVATFGGAAGAQKEALAAAPRQEMGVLIRDLLIERLRSQKEVTFRTDRRIRCCG